MKSLARWSFVFVAALSISAFGIQPQVEDASILANDSQDTNKQENQIQNNFLAESTENLMTNDFVENLTTQDSDEFQTNGQTDDTNKLVKKTVLVERKSAVRTFRATAYCLKGRMANGGGVRRGVVAADPRVLRLGTKVYLNAGPYSGTYTVSDTGGAIKGNILDVWVPSCSEANRFGRRTVSLSIVN